jgi:hypothetical protein
MREQIIISALCLAIVAGSRGVAAWTVITGEIGKEGLDALFLVLVCLLIAFAFSITPMQAWRQGLWRELRKGKAKASEPGTPTPQEMEERG